MAYPNRTINDGPYGSFMADPTAAALGLNVRCKFVDPSTTSPATTTPDGKPILQLCSATERADVITLQPIAAGAYGSVKFANAAGENFGVMSGNIATGVAIYGAASGKVSASSGGGALLIGKATSLGADGGGVTYTINIPAA